VNSNNQCKHTATDVLHLLDKVHCLSQKKQQRMRIHHHLTTGLLQKKDLRLKRIRKFGKKTGLVSLTDFAPWRHCVVLQS